MLVATGHIHWSRLRGGPGAAPPSLAFVVQAQGVLEGEVGLSVGPVHGQVEGLPPLAKKPLAPGADPSFGQAHVAVGFSTGGQGHVIAPVPLFATNAGLGEPSPPQAQVPVGFGPGLVVGQMHPPSPPRLPRAGGPGAEPSLSVWVGQTQGEGSVGGGLLGTVLGIEDELLLLLEVDEEELEGIGTTGFGTVAGGTTGAVVIAVVGIALTLLVFDTTIGTDGQFGEAVCVTHTVVLLPVG